MTERLTTLLNDEADHLDIPTPDTAAILGRGRGLRRRHRVTVAASSAAVVVLLAGGVAALVGPGSLTGNDAALDPAALDPAAPALQGWAVGQGSTVMLGSGETVEVEGTVKSVYYTSAGVLVRTGQDASTDASDSAYSLVTDDGKVTDFTLDLGDRVPGTDPTLPYLAYADETGDGWEVVLRDVRTGEVAAEIPFEGDFTWGGWLAPPVSLSGDHVYVGMDDATLDVEWRTGEVSESDVMPGSRMPVVSGGRTQLGDYGERHRVVDAQTGAEVLTTPASEDWMTLSPDGRYAVERSSALCDEDGDCVLDRPSVEVYDLAAGTHRSIPVPGGGIGWTPTGDLLVVDGDTVQVCDASTGSCAETPLDIDTAHLRLGGSIYEA